MYLDTLSRSHSFNTGMISVEVTCRREIARGSMGTTRRTKLTDDRLTIDEIGVKCVIHIHQVSKFMIFTIKEFVQTINTSYIT